MLGVKRTWASLAFLFKIVITAIRLPEPRALNYFYIKSCVVLMKVEMKRMSKEFVSFYP